MDTEIAKQAEEWLTQIYDDLVESGEYKKSNEELIIRIAWEIRLYTPELQKAVMIVLDQWLSGEDKYRSEIALSLILSLKATEFIPKLEQLREDILAGRPNLPTPWVSTVDNILGVLREAKREADKY
ncbi:MAG: hypothetical protein ABFD64_07960 [Armatimonadota bacterium]